MATQAERIDIIMWTKDGAPYLARVLPRIDAVLDGLIKHKIAIDDSSSDGTRDELKSNGWEVYPNDKGGIGNAANEALQMVTTDYFASFEQDIYLADNWPDVFSYMDNDTVSARGMRYVNIAGLNYLEKRTRGEQISVDNNLWNLNHVKTLGGFPQVRIGIDVLMKQRVISAGYKWKDVNGIQSLHLRKGFFEQLKHNVRNEKESALFCRDQFLEMLTRSTYRFFFSPIRAAELCLNHNAPVNVLYAYPLVRASILIGNLSALGEILARKRGHDVPVSSTNGKYEPPLNR